MWTSGGFPGPAGAEPTQLQKLAAIVGLVVVALAVVFALLPFNFAEGVPCGAPLLGAEAKTDRPVVGFAIPSEACADKGTSRITVAAVVALIASAAALAPTFVTPPGEDCRRGRHDDCRAWWANSMGTFAEAFSCQCRCHQAERQGKFRN